MARRQGHDLIAAAQEERIVRDEQCVGLLSDKGSKGRVDVAFSASGLYPAMPSQRLESAA